MLWHGFNSCAHTRLQPRYAFYAAYNSSHTPQLAHLCHGQHFTYITHYKPVSFWASKLFHWKQPEDSLHYVSAVQDSVPSRYDDLWSLPNWCQRSTPMQPKFKLISPSCFGFEKTKHLPARFYLLSLQPTELLQWSPNTMQSWTSFR